MEYLSGLVMAAAAQQDSGQSMTLMIMMFGTIALAFYFIIIRPQKREQRQRQLMLESVKKGDKVVTVGGIHGVVVDVDTNASIVTVEVAKNVRLNFTKSSVSSISKKGKDAKQKEAARATNEEKKK